MRRGKLRGLKDLQLFVMGQEFHVVRCFSCQSFQVQQVKKVTRWICKLCGEKQTLLKEFGRGSGADCRRHVQKLNAMRGAMMEEEEHNAWSLWKQEEEAPEEKQLSHDTQERPVQVSRWSKYMDTPEEAGPEEAGPEEAGPEETGPVFWDRKQLHGDQRRNRKRARDGETHTSEQLAWSSPKRPENTLETARSTSMTQCQTRNANLNQNQNQIRTTSLSRTNLNHPNSLSPEVVDGLGPGSVSRWACFLKSDCQVKEGTETLSGRSKPPGRPVSSQTPPLARTHPQLPVSSMFESGDDFTLDDF